MIPQLSGKWRFGDEAEYTTYTFDELFNILKDYGRNRGTEEEVGNSSLEQNSENVVNDTV